MSEEKVLSSQVIYEGRAVKLRVDTVRLPSGRQTTREVVEHSEVVVIIAIDNDGKLLLVRQYRSAVGKDLLEVVAGGIDPGEDAPPAVRRELREEAGYFPKQVKRMGGFYAAPGYCTEYLHLFLASDLVPERLIAEDTESISLVRVSASEVPGLILSGAICDAKSIAGLLAYLESRRSAKAVR